MSFLIDSDVLIDATRSRPTAQAWLDRHAVEILAVSYVSVSDMYHGAYNSANSQLQIRGISKFLSLFVLIGLDDATMPHFARERAALRRQRQPIADLDLLIAATAIANNLTLATRTTRHFEHIPGLALQSPDAT